MEAQKNWNAMMRFVGLVLFSFGWLVSYATPTISDLKVTSVEPIGIAIDFFVSGATADDASLPFEVSMTIGDATYYAVHLIGATNCVNGAHRVYWNMAKDGLAIDPMTASLTVKYEDAHGLPLYCVIDLSSGSSSDVYPIEYMSASPSGGFNTTEYKTTKLVLKRVDAGSFIMGKDQADESHRVTLTQSFYMGLYEVTQRQWELVTGSNPCSSTSYGKGDANPVHYVSYDDIRGTSSGAKWPSSNAVDASSFLGKLRTRTGLDFDLPTDAQWEYTCRAGTTTAYSYGDSADGAYMWYESNSSEKTHEVGTKLPNPWGFHDMHGNVWEWCLDWYDETLSYGTDPKGPPSGSYRVERAGCWASGANLCISVHRFLASASGSNFMRGFRLCETLSSGSCSTSATVEFALGRICADGSASDGKLSIRYVPAGSQNAVVAINGETLLDASEAGSWTWTAQTAGTYTVSHIVGGDVMSATYVVTNGYGKVEEEPCPPMGLVEGVSFTPSGEIAVAAKGVKQIVKIFGNGEAWTAVTSDDWLKLNSTSGTATGKGIVCTVAENINAEARGGYVYIAGQTLKVSQAGRGATVEEAVVADTAGGEVVVAVSVSDATTTWCASSACPWIQVETAGGTGSGEVRLQILPWNRTTSRTGTVTIAGHVVTVTQEAAKVEIEGGLVRYCNSAGLDSLVVTVRVDVATASWTPKISEGADGVWVFLMSGEDSVEGDGTFELYVASAGEGDALPRTATVTVGNASLRIVQDYGVTIANGGAQFVIPTSWFEKYPALGGTTPEEWQKIAEEAGVKTDASGVALPVWHDYVAGTDPTDAASRFTAGVAFEDGKPVVSWSPALNGEGVREGVRTYRVWGKANLTDATWSEVAPDGESDYRFFRVTVEMP